MKIRSMGASCSIRTDRQTDMTQLVVIFRSFSNAPNKTNINYASKSLPYLLEN